MIKYIITTLIKLYRRYLSPFFLPRCRFLPSCSEYSLECFEKYGTMKGTYLTIKRILKCHPFHPGGYDPVPDKPIPEKSDDNATDQAHSSIKRNRSAPTTTRTGLKEENLAEHL